MHLLQSSLLRLGARAQQQRNSNECAAARVISADDDEKKPLWRYMRKIENTGKGKGGNSKFSFRLCDREISGRYSRARAHLLKKSNPGVSFCWKVTLDVLVLPKIEQERGDERAANRAPKDIPFPSMVVGPSGRKRSGTNRIYSI